MKKIVISLKNSDRRTNFDKLFSDLEYYFFDAIEPQKDDSRFDQLIAKLLYGRELRKGEIGCTLSHAELIRNFSEECNGGDWLLVMEDDALPEDAFFSFINTFPNNKAISVNTPTVFLLGHSKTKKNHLFTQALKQPLYLREDVVGCQFGQNVRITRCGTVGYLINKQAAVIISRISKPFWMADDWHLFSNLGVAIKHPVKPLIYEDLSYGSTTENEIRYHHDFFKQPISTLIDIFVSRYRYYKDLFSGVYDSR